MDCLEGKPYKKFLHLEDQKIQDPLSCLKDSNGTEVNSTDSILNIFYNFYKDLYACKMLSPSQKDMEKFLRETSSLPKISCDISYLVGLITSKEVHKAIKCLCSGKALGCDGLTSDFFKHFQDEISDILLYMFNRIYEDKTLSPSQKLTIIILIFKKGDPK